MHPQSIICQHIDKSFFSKLVEKLFRHYNKIDRKAEFPDLCVTIHIYIYGSYLL